MRVCHCRRNAPQSSAAAATEICCSPNDLRAALRIGVRTQIFDPFAGNKDIVRGGRGTRAVYHPT
jgi:hypothetical protein